MKQVFFSVIFFLGTTILKAQVNTTVDPSILTPKKYVDDFMAKRFGMFIHWGPVALRGTEIGWSRNREVKQAEYDSLYKEFNPVLFNADSWVKAAKDAGMKYLTITAKHHDGFCLWPTKFTDYNIMNSPFKRDVVGELAKSCKKYGIKFCIYYTVLDWYDLRYPVRNDGTKTIDPKGDMVKFVQYMKDQLKELITNYDPYMLWFDGNWEQPWTKEMGADVYSFIKKLSPSVVINNRLGKGTHKTMGPDIVGDYATPEQVVGKMNLDMPWESCITICNQWAWKANDKMKSLQQCIQTLASTVGGNGNLLFNVGPMMDGRMEKRQVDRLKEMGEWLKVNGDAIYGTKAGPFMPDSLMAATRKGNRINLMLFKKVGDQLVIPNIDGRKILRAFFMKGDNLSFEQGASTISINLPKKLPDPNCTVVVLEMDGDVENLSLIKKILP
jgi:alpha-L-fucosidase